MTERSLLEASAIEGAIQLAHRRRLGQTGSEALDYLRTSPVSVSNLDFDRGLQVAELVGWDTIAEQISRIDAYREILASLIKSTAPHWARHSILGRGKALARAPVDAIQCLRTASLLDADIGDSGRKWWTDLATFFRAQRDAELRARGRQGELLSMQREKILVRQFTELQPVWVALDDETLGYDIESWRATKDGGVVPVIIEAKMVVPGGNVHVTRGEWRAAVKDARKFELQVWTDGESDPVVLFAEQLSSHIPNENGAGRWESVVIPARRLMG
jgi:Domain of unknown function (DUF3883)